MTTPGELLNIGPNPGCNKFNIGIGRLSGHTDYSPDKIAAGFSSTPEFVATPTGVRFQVRMDAARTSSGTKYPRTELREYDLNGITRAGWDGRRGTHWMAGESRILHLPPRKPWVCITQIHDAKSDLVRVQTEGQLGALKVVCRNTPPGTDDEQSAVVLSDYVLGTWIKWRFEVISGFGRLYLDGKMVREFPANAPGCYFKAGAYAQTNSKDVGESPDEYVEVELRGLRHWHTGWPELAPPVVSPPLPAPGVPVTPTPPVEPSPSPTGPPEKPVEPGPPLVPPLPAPIPPGPAVPAWALVVARCFAWLAQYLPPWLRNNRR